MELVQVRILGQAITARYGTLSTGDIINTDAAYAKHLVDDAKAAEYVTAKPGSEAADADDKTPATNPGADAGSAAIAADGKAVPPKSLTVEQIKAALAEKNIAIPEGVTKKPDLQALLDASTAG